MKDNASVIATAVSAALEAGKAILEIYDSDNFDIQEKKDRSPLTRADTKSQQIIRAHLTKRFPSIPFLGEEGQKIPYSERRSWQSFWLVDPLDGTKEFIKRNGEFTVNIALMSDNLPIAGVVYAPVIDTLYMAAKGLGSYRLEADNLKQLLQSNDPVDFQQLASLSKKLEYKSNPDALKVRVIASRSHLTAETEEFIQLLKHRYGSIELITAGSSLKICRLAEGNADIYPRFGPTMEWDTAAGHAVLNQAGGCILSFPACESLVYNKENLLNPFFIASTFSAENLNRIIADFSKS